MDRRTVLAGVAVGLSAGCVTDRRVGIAGDESEDTEKEDMNTGIVEAIAVEQLPTDAEATPRANLENPHVSEAIANVCDDEDAETQVRVSGEEIEAVKTRLGALPSYTPPQGSDHEYGNYVACDGQYAVVRLLLED